MKRRTKTKRCKYNKSKKNTRGGNVIPMVPGPIVGSPWTYSPATWPGVDGVQGNNNYYPLNKYYSDPQRMQTLNGGKRRLKSKKVKCRLKGGFFNEIHNIGSDYMYQMNSVLNINKGIPLPINGEPYVQNN